MLYFEDALWIRDNFWKDAIGTLYFVLGFIGIAFHLILISIVPEIATFITRPTMLILSAQFTASILQLFVIFVPVPAMIAVNKPYFINEVLINVPSFLLVMAQAFSLCFMMVNGAHRNLKIVSGKIGKIIFADNVIFVLIGATFCCSLYFSILICAQTTIRRFSPSQLTWTIQNFETTAFKYLVILIAIPSMLTYTLALSRLTYQKLKNRKPSNPEEITGSDESRETICSTLSYVIFDAMFLLYLSPPGLGISAVAPIISIAHTFLIAYWPVLTVVALDIHVRAALIYRVRGIFQPQALNSPIVIHANKNKHSSY